MNDNLIIMGINAPRQHQAIIAKLVYGLMELYMAGRTTLFPYPETMIDESQTSPVPDVMLVDIASDLTKVIIEITHTQGLKKDLQKMQQLMQEYEVPEGFVYDYKRSIWYRCDLNTKNPEEQNAYCSAIHANLNDFLK